MEQNSFETIDQLKNASLNSQKVVAAINAASEANAAHWKESSILHNITGATLQWSTPHTKDVLPLDRWQTLRNTLSEEGLELSYWFVTVTADSHVWTLFNPFCSREFQVVFKPNSAKIAGFRYKVLENEATNIFTSQLLEAVLLNQS